MTSFPQIITDYALITARNMMDKEAHDQRTGYGKQTAKKSDYVRALNAAEALLAEAARREMRDENGFYF